MDYRRRKKSSFVHLYTHVFMTIFVLFLVFFKSALGVCALKVRQRDAWTDLLCVMRRWGKELSEKEKGDRTTGKRGEEEDENFFYSTSLSNCISCCLIVKYTVAVITASAVRFKKLTFYLYGNGKDEREFFLLSQKEVR